MRFWALTYVLCALCGIGNDHLLLFYGWVQSWENFLTYPSAQGVIMDYVRFMRTASLSFAANILPWASTSTKYLVIQN